MTLQTKAEDPTGEPGVRQAPSWRDRVRAVRLPGVTPLNLLIAGALIVLVVTGSVLVARSFAPDRSVHLISAPGGAPPTPPADLAALAPEDFVLSPDALRALDADAARRFNQAIPFSSLPIVGAKPFIMTPDDIVQYSRALDCLTAAVYYEAASEAGPGQAAVAQVVLNRMRHPAYPGTVCGVVFEGADRPTGCQFSFTCDGAMDRAPSALGWARAKAVASAALNGAVAVEVGMATHYHTDWVAPYWAERLVKMKQIGAHIFYRWTGSWGLPRAFVKTHSGVEPIVAKMAALTTPLEMLDPPAEPILPTVEISAPLPSVLVQSGLEAPTPAEPPRPAVAAPAPTPAPPPTRAATAPVIADPLAPQTAPPPRRSRIAVPSGW